MNRRPYEMESEPRGTQFSVSRRRVVCENINGLHPAATKAFAVHTSAFGAAWRLGRSRDSYTKVTHRCSRLYFSLRARACVCVSVSAICAVRSAVVQA